MIDYWMTLSMMKKLCSLCLALVFGLGSARAQLDIAHVGNQFLLSSPLTASNSILQSATNLSAPAWIDVTNQLQADNNTLSTTIPATNTPPVQFYRLFPATGMALIPAGSFTMGDSLDGESDAIPTNIFVSTFFMDTNLVNYSKWTSIYAWATNRGYAFNHPGSAKATNHPVVFVDWFDTVKWCNARSHLAGLSPVYYTDSAFTRELTNGEPANVYVNWTASGYRLPTEAEWEKAARGGAVGLRFPWGNTISETQANYNADTTDYVYDLGPYEGHNTNFDAGSSPYTSQVGYFGPNRYGLNDMAGNVFVWCTDWYGSTYAQPTTNNPTGPVSGSQRVIRCGSWVYTANYSRCANRNDNNATVTHEGLGFRCVIRQ